MIKTEIQELFETLNDKTVHMTFSDGEQSWYYIMSITHVCLNNTVIADKVSGPNAPDDEVLASVQFDLADVVAVKDADGVQLFSKK